MTNTADGPVQSFDPPKGCSCHPDNRPPICPRAQASGDCWIAFHRTRANEAQQALIEIRHAASKLRGEQAYREFPLYVKNRVKEALQIKGRESADPTATPVHEVQ